MKTDDDGHGSPVAGLDLRPALEAVLMVVDEPATEEHLAKVLQRPRRAVADALRELADEYTVQRRGFDLRLVAGGFSTRTGTPARMIWTASALCVRGGRLRIQMHR